jgi:hypothetical protein
VKDYTQQIANNFSEHVVDEEQVELMKSTRVRCRILAEQINEDMPECREKSIALTKLKEVMFWINAGIARRE